MDELLHAEARRFARYLVDREPGAKIQARYARAVGAGAHGARDEALLALARRRPRTIGLLDAGLALADPHAELRRRLYLMFAILESTPEHSECFLPVRRGPAYALVVALAGARAALKGACGVLLLRAVAPR
jgi:hypothetical protein